MPPHSEYAITIDWLSVTFPNGEMGISDIAKMLPEFKKWIIGNGRAPYSMSYRTKGLTIYMSKTKGSLFELSGEGCQIITHDHLAEFMKIGSVTRIDIAIDYELPISAIANPVTANGRWNTDTGITFYYGSPKSDSMIRVYRYNKPHPRSHLTRLESVFRRRYAKAITRAYLENDIDSIIATIIKKCNRHKIDHMLQCSGNALTMYDPAKQTHLSGTLRWMKVQVNPAIKKLLDEGITIDMIENLLFDKT